MSAYDHSFDNLDRTLEEAGRHMSRAIGEIALEIGGEQFAAKVMEASLSDTCLPNPEALTLLEIRYPRSSQLVERRAMKIRAHEHRREHLRDFGRAILNSFATMGGGMSRIGIAQPHSMALEGGPLELDDYWQM